MPQSRSIDPSHITAYHCILIAEGVDPKSYVFHHLIITFIKIVVVNPPPPVQSPGVCHLSMEMADERDGQR